jgi:hypothetical protein
MFENKIRFLVIGPTTAITYKEIFSHIKNNEMWLGYHHHLTGLFKPDGTMLKKNDPLPRGCGWYTNLDASYRHDRLILTEKFSPDKNPKYYNYNGIDVASSKDIPYDYEGYIGVPVTFLEKFSPDQFEIIGKSGDLAKPMDVKLEARLKGGPRFYIREQNGSFKRLFERIVIRNKEVYHDEDDG